MTTYTTKNDAIQNEIINPLGEYAEEHNIEAIADQVLTTTGEGTNYAYTLREDIDFWDVVANNSL